MSSAALIPDPERAATARAEAFCRACACFATGVAIATVRADDGSPQGLTVSSFTSVSLRPPMVLICVDHGCDALPHFRSNEFFAVNILHQEQAALSVRFSELPDGRFDGVEWYVETTGAPLLRGVLAVIECRVTQAVEAGDHAVLIGEVIRAESQAGKPLVYFDQNYRAIE